MAIHKDLPSMSVEAIGEYLAIAKHCVTMQKPGGGIYGYPAVLLLFSVVEALSNYASYPRHSLGGIKSIFPPLTENQIRNIKNWYRNLPAHSAIIMPGTVLTPEITGDPIEFGPKGEPTLIRLKPLYEAVKVVWDNFDKTKISPKIEPEQAPKAPIVVHSSLPGASGSYAVTTAIPTQYVSVTKRVDE